MNQSQVEYLCAIEQARSINAAAARLGASQQAVSQAVQRLERELGCSILKRSAQGVAFTPEGEIVLDAAHKIHDAQTEMQERLKGTPPHEQAGRICFGATIVTYRYYASLALRAFRRKHPNVSLERKIATIGKQATLVRKGEVEFAIVSFLEVNREKTERLPEGVSFHEIGRSRLDVMISEDHPCAHYARPSLKTVAQYPYIISTEQNVPDAAILRLLRRFGEDGDANVLEANNDHAVGSLVEDGMGWAFTMEGDTRQRRGKTVTRPIKESLFVIVGYFVDEHAQLSQLASDFIATFAEGGADALMPSLR